MRVVSREILGLYYLLPVGDNNLNEKPMELNQTAYEMYRFLSQGMSVEEVSKVLADKYGVTSSEVQPDVVSCYDRLHSKGIL